jgi:hypothetical protein
VEKMLLKYGKQISRISYDPPETRRIKTVEPEQGDAKLRHINQKK